jgi:hypothetical protein
VITSHGYWRAEARQAPWRLGLGAAAVGALVVLGSHAILLAMPRAVHQFLEDGLAIRGTASVLLANDLLATYVSAARAPSCSG